MKRTALLILVFLLGCSKPDAWKIASPTDIPESDSAPKILKLLDMGSYSVPCCGKIRPDIPADGKVMTGETVLIRGSNFGRGPTVSIGDKACDIVARTEDGGIVVKVPSGVPEGAANVVVSNEYGASTARITVTRLAAVRVPGASMHLLDVATGNKVTDIPGTDTGARAVFSSTAPFLYVYTGGVAPSLLTVNLAAQGKPTIVNRQKLPAGRLFTMGLPGDSRFLIIAVEKGYEIFDLAHPEYPVVHSFIDWPRGIDPGKVVDMALAPDGKVLTILQKPNEIKMLDVQVWDKAAMPHDLGPVLKDAQAPMAKALAFLEKNGTTMWVATGDTPESLKVGYHPATIEVYGYTGPRDRTSQPEVRHLGTYRLSTEHYTPQFLVPATRGADRAEDARLSSGSFFLYVAAAHTELMTLGTNPLVSPSGIQQGTTMLAQTGNARYRLMRYDETSTEKTFWSTPRIVGALAISADGKKAVSVECEPIPDTTKSDVSFKCGYSMGPVKGDRVFVKEGTFTKERFLPPFRFGAAAVQE